MNYINLIISVNLTSCLKYSIFQTIEIKRKDNLSKIYFSVNTDLYEVELISIYIKKEEKMELEELISEFTQSRYNDLSIEKGDQSIYLRRGTTNFSNDKTENEVDSNKQKTQRFGDTKASDDAFIKSDRVGIFSSLVKAGDRIIVGDKVALITAINVSHDLYAQVSGFVKSIVVESGVGVAFGMNLIELDAKDV